MPRHAVGKARVIQAIHENHGLVSQAAVALGVSASTVHRSVMRWPEVREALHQERTVVLDLAEQQLFRAMERGESWAIMFLLKTIGKSRGYTERTEISGSGGGPVEFVDLTNAREHLASRLAELAARRIEAED